MKIFLLLLLIFFSISCSGGSTQPTRDKTSIVVLNSGWQYRFGDSPLDSNGTLIWLADSLNSPEWKSLTSLDKIPPKGEYKSLWLRIKLPAWQGFNPAISVGQAEQVLQVYLNSNRIYNYGDFTSVNNNHFNGWIRHLIQLPDSCNYKVLTFRFWSEGQTIGITAPILFGSTYDILNKMFIENFDDIIFASIFICFGCVLLFLFIVNKRNLLFLGMAIFVLSVGFFTGSNSLFLQMVFNAPYSFFFVDNISLFLAPLGAFLMIEQIIGSKLKRVFKLLWQSHLLFLLISLVINQLPGKNFANTFDAFFILLSINAIISISLMIISTIKGGIEIRLLLIGMVAFIFFAFGDVFIFYTDTYSNGLEFKVSFFHIGVICFLGSLVWIIIHNYFEMSRQKESAHQKAFFAVENEKETRKKYTQKLLSVQEDECKRISFELHDSVGQDLLVVKNLIKFGKKNKIDFLKDENYYQSIYNSTSKAIEEVRDISRALHPVQLVNLGLTQSIKSMINGFKQASQIEFILKIANIDDILKSGNEIHLYRVLQESLNNIIKHSEANVVNISISIEEGIITIYIKDNGKGFDEFLVSKQSNGLGLSSLSERISLLQGELNINSEINNGTKIIAKIPIKKYAPSKQMRLN